MNACILQWIQAVSAIITPIVILVLGLKINKVLEKNKLALAKEKEWRSKWADRFYSAAIDYNNSIEECIVSLFQMNQLLTEKHPGWEKRFEEKRTQIVDMVGKNQRVEWSLRTTVEFAPNSKNNVLKYTERVRSQVNELLSTKKGDLEAIRVSLFEFNQAAMMAHRDLLGW
jgi:hypothetical protein